MKKYRNLIIGIILSILFSIFSIYYLNINELNFKISQYNFLSNALENENITGKLNYNITNNFNYDVFDNIRYRPSSIPVLGYYSVDIKSDSNTYWISILNFEAQMDYLSKNNYHTLNSADLYSFIESGICDVVNPVVITFDIGYKDFYENAFPILKKYNFKAILFQITANVDELSNSLSSDELREISDYGIDIGIRGNTNSAMEEISPSDKDRVVKSGADDLKKILNKNPIGFSFPHGAFDESTVEYLNKYNILAGFILKNEQVKKGQNLYNIPRILIDENINMNSFIGYIKSIY